MPDLRTGSSPLSQLSSVTSIASVAPGAARNSAMAAILSPQVLKMGEPPHIICERSQPSASQISMRFSPALSRWLTG
ncbi:hypothetical protein D3C87_1488420 [compost metagenome]